MHSDKTEELHWYVGCVRSCQEKKVSESLAARSVRFYLPFRREVHTWSDRRKVVDCPVIPRFVFIRCRNAERAAILEAEPRIWRFLPEAGKAAVVRDEQMEAFMRIVEQGGGEVKLSERSLAPGDNVLVTTGPLSGLRCELISVGGGRCLAVRLGALGTATMDLDIETVEKISIQK